MDTHLEIIQALANGSDPMTGEVLPRCSPYNDPTVIRALFAIIEQVKNPPKRMPKTVKTTQQRQSENLAHGLPENAGLPWTREQRDNLAARFNQGIDISVLAGEHKRTKAAITAELKKQGLIED